MEMSECAVFNALYEADTEPLGILQLNDDCLIKIFSYLNNYQLIDILGICRKFDEIIYINLRQCKSISINFRFLNTDLSDEKLLWLAGPFLNSLEFSVGYSMSTELVLAAFKPIVQCTKLKSLTIHYVTMCEQYLRLIASISDHLERIDLSFCQLTDELMAEFFKWHCSCLKELIAIGNYTFFGSSLIYLRNLESLVVESHEDFSINLHQIKANNPQADIVIYEKGRLNVIDINI